MLLKIGSKGEDVKKIQIKLGLTPDGDFGPKTEAAVKEWQKENGLTPDGIIGSITWGKMFPINTKKFEDLDLSKLEGHIPSKVLEEIPSAAEKFNITNVLRLSHFLSQCGHESGGFKFITENLNYSEQGLKAIFGKYFPGDLASEYARDKVRIGSRVYADRMGNGPESTQEGYKFRGRGYIQLTGKNNYSKFSEFIGEDCVANPELVSDKYPLSSAAFFFDSNNLWTICDLGDTEDVIKKVTKRVNGGYNGLEDRIKHFNEYYHLLS
jgi:putative chitinase